MIPPLGPAARARRAAVQEREELVVARLQTLAPQLDGEPDPDFHARTRARLVAMAAVRQPAAEREAEREVAPKRVAAASAAPARWRGRLTAGLAGAALAVTTAAGAVALSTGAGPGDVLYGVKRGTEETQLALAGDARRGATLLQFASTRLAELEEIVESGDPDPALVTETLATMDQQTRDGAAWQGRLAVEDGDVAPLARLAEWRAEQSEGLLALGDEIPAGAADRYGLSLALLDEVGVRVDGLESAVQCPTGPATDGSDELGPLPGACAPEVAQPGAPGGSDNPAEAPGTDAGSGNTGGGTSGDPGGGAPGSGAPGVPVPTGPDAPVESPELPTDQPTFPTVPLPPLPGSGGGTDGQEPAPSAPTLPLPSLPVCVPLVTC